MTPPPSQPPKKKSGRRKAQPDPIETAEIKSASTKNMVLRGTKNLGRSLLEALMLACIGGACSEQ